MEQLDLKTLSFAILQIAEEKGISKEKVVEIIETALAAAYKKEYGKKNERYRARFDKENSKAEFFLVKKVVDENMILPDGEEEEIEDVKVESVKKQKAPVAEDFSEKKQILDKETGEDIEGEDGEKKIKFNSARHIMIKEARKIKKKIKLEEEMEFSLPRPEKFGRIAAQTAKQVLLQQIKEAEKESILSEFSKKEGEILSGIVQRKEGETIFVDVNKTTTLLLREDQIPGEFYKLGNRMRFFCLKVKEASRGPEIYLSRSHPKFLSKIFEIEVPEISSGSIEIKAVAREVGFRSKIAVFSKEEGVDPIGSCVGARGTRVNAVMQELGREKIDIIAWNEKPEEFIKSALSPAKVVGVEIKENKAEVKVPKDQLSLAIGKEGQNVRLASDLTGWKIDVVEAKEESIS